MFHCRRPPFPRSNVSLMNASFNLDAPSVTTPQSFWLFAARDARQELSRAWHGRKLVDPFRTCVEEMAAQACTPGGFSATVSKQVEHGHQAEYGQAQWAEAGKTGGSPAAAAAWGEAAQGGAGEQRRGSLDLQARAARPEEHGQPAPTFAERLAGSSGRDMDARGQLAAALCKARQDILLSVFVTRPAVWSPLFNLIQVACWGGAGVGIGYTRTTRRREREVGL